MVRKFKRVCEIIHELGATEKMLIPILHAVQREYRYLPEDVLAFVATSLGISAAKVYGVASFYAYFSLVPKGKYVVKICDGTACHVKGSIKIYDKMRAELGLTGDKSTCDDMLFTIETVSCLGACGLAPVVTVNEKVYGQVNEEQAAEIINDIKATEEADEPVK